MVKWYIQQHRISSLFGLKMSDSASHINDSSSIVADSFESAKIQSDSLSQLIALGE